MSKIAVSPQVQPASQQPIPNKKAHLPEKRRTAPEPAAVMASASPPKQKTQTIEQVLSPKADRASAGNENRQERWANRLIPIAANLATITFFASALAIASGWVLGTHFTSRLLETSKEALEPMSDKLIAVGKQITAMSGGAIAIGNVFIARGTKQPSILAAGLINALAGLGVWLFPNSLFPKGGFDIGTGFFRTGIANNIKNTYETPHARREFDIEFLKRFKLSYLWNPNAENGAARQWWQRFREMLRYIGEDQVLATKQSFQVVRELLTQPGNTAQKIQKAAKQTQAIITPPPGQRPELPDFAKPQSGQNYLSATLSHALGFLLFPFGDWVNPLGSLVGQTVAGTIGVVRNVSMIPLGLMEKGLAAKSLLIGTPMSIIGTAYQHLDLGWALKYFGDAAGAYYYASLRDADKAPKPLPAAPPVSQPLPSKSPPKPPRRNK